MQIKLVASDLDGTIIDKNNKISPKNFTAIKKLHDKNVKFVICTGKSYSISKKICDKFEAQYGIFGNGNQIVDLKNGKEIWSKQISNDDLKFIITFAKSYNFHTHIYLSSEVVSEKLSYLDLRNYRLKNLNSSDEIRYRLVPNILKYVESKKTTAFSVVVSSSKNNLKEFEKVLELNKNISYTYIRKRGMYRDEIIGKDYEYLNITAEGVNKDVALSQLEQILGISKNSTLAIGDNINDIEMVKNSGIGVAVFDSYNDLKEVATYTTKSSTSDGAFSEAIEKFVR